MSNCFNRYKIARQGYLSIFQHWPNVPKHVIGNFKFLELLNVSFPYPAIKRGAYLLISAL